MFLAFPSLFENPATLQATSVAVTLWISHFVSSENLTVMCARSIGKPLPVIVIVAPPSGLI